MKHQCPVCGSALRGISFAVDLSHNLVIIDDEPIRIAPKMAELAWLLREHYPDVVSTDRIFQRIWAGGEHPILPTLKTHITKTRRMLEPRGWTIRNVFGFGYALEEMKR